MVKFALFMAISCGFRASWALAAENLIFSPSATDFGGTGLLQMPNARLAEEGEFLLGHSWVDPYRRYYFTLQPLPWLEGTLRYTQIDDLPYFSSGGRQSYKDRGIDLKVRLLRETGVWPELAVGLRDVGGTNLFSSEYLVASRRWYNLDFTLGMAWGNAGTRGHLPNPLGYLYGGFNSRPRTTGAGSLAPVFFRGKSVSLFGGIEYRTPIDGLRLKLEYDGNDYQTEPAAQPIDVRAPVNVGIQYAPLPWIELTLAYERGSAVMARGSFRSNFNKDKGLPKVDPPPPPISPPAANPPIAQALSELRVADDPLKTLTEEFQPLRVQRTGKAAVVVIPAERGLPSGDRLAEAALLALRRDATSSLDAVTFIAERDGRAVASTSFKRADLERARAMTLKPTWPQAAAEWRAAQSALPNLPHASRAEDRTAVAIFADLEAQGFIGHRFNLSENSATLEFSHSVYRNPARALGRAARIVARHTSTQVAEIRLILVEAGFPISETRILRKDVVALAEGRGSVDETMAHARIGWPSAPSGGVRNSALYPRIDWSVAPKLRQHVGGPDEFFFYQIYGKAAVEAQILPGLSVSGVVGVDLVNNFEGLRLRSDSRLPHVRSDIKDYLQEGKQWIDALNANYIFSPYRDIAVRASAGIFELMYSGVGAEILYRPSGRRWAIGVDGNYVRKRAFDGGLGLQDYKVATGHVTYYHELPYRGVLATLSGGRYLAGDVGATLGLQKTFDNGVTFGVWATKTNVSAAQFGEGSFDKGFFVNIPLDLFSFRSNTNAVSFAWRPLTRDGGQKLGIPKPLYSVTGAASQGAIIDGWRQFGE